MVGNPLCAGCDPTSQPRALISSATTNASGGLSPPVSVNAIKVASGSPTTRSPSMVAIPSAIATTVRRAASASSR